MDARTKETMIWDNVCNWLEQNYDTFGANKEIIDALRSQAENWMNYKKPNKEQDNWIAERINAEVVKDMKDSMKMAIAEPNGYRVGLQDGYDECMEKVKDWLRKHYSPIGYEGVEDWLNHLEREIQL